MRRLSVMYDFATDAFWISLSMRKILFSFLSVQAVQDLFTYSNALLVLGRRWENINGAHQYFHICLHCKRWAFAGVHEKNLLFLFTKIRTSLVFPKLKCGEINIYCTFASATVHCVRWRTLVVKLFVFVYSKQLRAHMKVTDCFQIYLWSTGSATSN